MNIVFISNYLNHHQLPICLEFIKECENFYFIATEALPLYRKELGYEDMNKKDFVIKEYENHNMAQEKTNMADVIIIGGDDKGLLKNQKNKLIFKYTERIYKQKFSIKIWLYLLYRYYFIERKYYLLCSSAYTSGDYFRSLAYINKAFKWGYFPRIDSINKSEIVKKFDNKKVKLLWVGRFIDWKHPEYVVELAKQVKNKQLNCEILMIGTGALHDKIIKDVSNFKLEKILKISGSLPNQEVLEHMKKSNIYLFTSDYNEGWGAVLNEAMQCGCAVVASPAPGSVPFLMKNNYNGVIYSENDINDFIEKTIALIQNDENQLNYALNAIDSINNEWSVHNIVSRFLDFANCKLSNKKCSIPASGPMSKAKPYSNKKTNKLVISAKYK